MLESQSTTAVLFPGQGSQRPGMGEAATARCPDLVELAGELIGDDPFERAEDGTRFQQPALYLAGIASWLSLEGEMPAVLAGHSLGEITALAAAGVLDHDDGLRLVVARGALMQDAADRTETGMAAVRGDRATVDPLLDGLDVVLANDNSPQQVVVAGSNDALEAATQRLGDAGMRAKRLAVAGAFHSLHMTPAIAPFRDALAGVALGMPQVPVLSCSTAQPFELRRIPDQLAAALTSPVRWVDTLRELQARGVTRFVEVAPGRVLSGLVRKTLGDVEVVTIDDPEHAHA